jgi:hypothetical protein
MFTGLNFELFLSEAGKLQAGKDILSVKHNWLAYFPYPVHARDIYHLNFVSNVLVPISTSG